MDIKHIVLHTLQTDQNKLIFSDATLEITAEKPFKQMERKLAACFKSNNAKPSTFASTSEVKALLDGYVPSEPAFLELSQNLAQRLFDIKHTNGLYTSSTLLVAELVYHDVRYLVGVDSGLKKGMRLTTREENAGMVNDLEEYSMLFSPAISSKDFVFLYDVLNKQLITIESPVKSDMETYNVLSTLFLEATSSYSYRQGMKLLDDISKDVMETFALDPLVYKPKLKSYIYDQVQDEGVLDVKEMVETVLTAHPQAMMKMQHECEKVELSELSNIANQFNKADQMQKFVTDLGIEIYIPLDYVQNTNVFELEMEADALGTITIKNIAGIISR
ncbi:MAG: nucleoid-associated protein [Erysipelotrichaceae bacterium]